MGGLAAFGRLQKLLIRMYARIKPTPILAALAQRFSAPT
jgi:hypothetical protein